MSIDDIIKKSEEITKELKELKNRIIVANRAENVSGLEEDDPQCPNCGVDLDKWDEYAFCPDCGQRLAWVYDDVEEEDEDNG